MYKSLSRHTLTIQIHLTMDKPSPDKAPQRPAIVLNRQIEHKKPIQLKKNATVIKMLLFKMLVPL